MRTHEIENWALNIIDRVKAGHPNEDHRVELKAAWPDPYKAARRIAGHGNAARGESFLWLIGVDKKLGVKGVSMTDLARWYAQVESQFDGLAPDMTPLNIHVDGNTIVALLFESDRAPFVIKAEGIDWKCHGGEAPPSGLRVGMSCCASYLRCSNYPLSML